MEAAYLGNAAAAIEIAMLGNHPVDVAGLTEWMTTRSELDPPTSARPAELAMQPA